MGCAGSKQGVARASVSPVKVAQALAAPQGTRSEDNNLNGPTTEDARGRATSSASQLSATKTAAETPAKSAITDAARAQSSSSTVAVPIVGGDSSSEGDGHETKSLKFDTMSMKSSYSSRKRANDVIGQIFVALYPYVGDVGDLTFAKGEEIVVLNCDDGDWFRARSLKTQQEGYVPSNFFVLKTSFSTEPWFHGQLSRQEADRYLSRVNRVGCYLVRESANKHDTFVLDVKDANDAVRHYQIKRTPNGGYCISRQMAFNSLKDLVTFYTLQPEGLCTLLTVPCPKAGPYLKDLGHGRADNWEIPRTSVTLDTKLGEGEFGSVYQGWWNGVIQVAVKTLKPGAMNAEDFLKEATLMKKLQHPHLVRLYAVCTDSQPYYIILEYMAKGSMLSYLRKMAAEKESGGKGVTWKQKADMAAQIAAGMAFVESINMIHRDLAARNILINGEMMCKVADFGLARTVGDGGNESEDVYKAKEGTKFPVKWTAPEAALFNQFSVKSDVWSFGVLLMEIATDGQTPYPGMKNIEVLQEIKKGFRQPKPDDCPDIFYEVMLQCWAQNQEQRPTFSRLQTRLEELFEILE